MTNDTCYSCQWSFAKSVMFGPFVLMCSHNGKKAYVKCEKYEYASGSDESEQQEVINERNKS